MTTPLSDFPLATAIGSTVVDRIFAQDEFPRLLIADDQCVLARERALVRAQAYDLTASVFAHMSRHAAAAPNALAIRDWRGDIDYGDLVDRVRRLAGLLAEADVVAGQVVAVAGPRNANCIIAFLATELVGAVYLPIDACWPSRRIADVLESAAAAMVLLSGPGRDEQSGVEQGAKACDCPVRLIDDSNAHAPFARDPVSQPNSPRYLLYTSGSTGTPKGAVIEHQGMINHLHCKVADLGMTSADQVAQTAPLVFDISIWQMLVALVAGGCVTVLDDDQVQDPGRLMAACERHGVTILEVVPTIMRLMLEEHRRGASRVELKSLRHIVSTGEELPAHLARQWLAHFPAISLLNAYGPTECSDDVTHHFIASVSDDVLRVPVGGPVANTSIHVLKDTADGWVCCDDNETGEIFVGGVGVGRGYLGNAAQTGVAFFIDPFFETPTGRLYKTGDAGRRLPGGVLEYLGRVDRQVKIAGVRMELGEIEAMLCRHPSVTASAVKVAPWRGDTALVARETRQVEAPKGRDRLCAYVCGDGVDLVSLKHFLQERLPAAMVPDSIVVLSDLPVTRNGKVDYKNLPEAPWSTIDSARVLVPTQGTIEAVIAQEMARVLGSGPLGREDAFLSIGGDSLLAMTLVARLRAAGIDVTVRDVFLGNSVAKIARRIGDGRAAATSIAAPSRKIEGLSDRRRPLSAQQSGVYFHWRLAPTNPYYTYQGSLAISGPLDVDRLRASWRALLEESPAILARFIEVDGAPVQEISHWNVEIPPVIDLRSLAADDRAASYRQRSFHAAGEPFDLGDAPGLRAQLFAFGPTEHRLLLTMHEILLDGWGANLLITRLSELYTASRQGPPAANPASRAVYDDYLRWHATQLASPSAQAAGRYWEGQLAGALPILDLPTYKARPVELNYRSASVECVLDEALMAAMKSLCANLSATPFMTILGAYAIALGYLSGTDEVVVGAPIANRQHTETAAVPAFLINMLPFRFSIDVEMTARKFLETSRDLVMSGFGASDFPFGAMTMKRPELHRDTTRTPVFQTMFNMLNYPADLIVAEGASWRFTELDTGYTKYDVALYAQRHTRSTLLLQLAYQVDLFDEADACRILSATVSVLRAMAADPQVRLRDIDILTSSELDSLAAFEHTD